MRISPQSRTASVELSEQLSGSIADSTGRPSVNQDAFRVFYSRTKGPLQAYLLRISRRPDVADDLRGQSGSRIGHGKKADAVWRVDDGREGRLLSSCEGRHVVSGASSVLA